MNVVLIHDIKDLLANYNYSLHHTLREGNQCVDFLAKVGATSDAALVSYSSPPIDLLLQLKIDVSGTFLPRHSFFSFLFLLFVCFAL
jgi:hypothetical protein